MTARPARVALVTGAAGGIGRASVQALLADGFSVVAADRAFASLPCGLEPALEAVAADLTREADVAAMIATCERRFGRLDAVVHLAGAVGRGPLVDVTPGEWRELLEVNLTSAFLVARGAHELLARQGGSLLLTSSTNGLNGGSALSGPAYAAAKAGLVNLGRYLAREWAPDRIRVNTIAPGPVDTPMLARLPADGRAALERAVPLGRIATAEEVAGLIAFLCSPRAAYLTGTVLNISGGLVLD